MSYFHSSDSCTNNQNFLFFLILVETMLTHSLLAWFDWKWWLLKSILTITLGCIISSHRLSIIRHCAINISCLIRIITYIYKNRLSNIWWIRLGSIQRYRLPIWWCSIDTSLRYDEWLTHVIFFDLCSLSWFRRTTTHLIIFLNHFADLSSLNI